MTWLSRLLPQSSSRQRRANHNNRARQSQRHRRMSTLEALENRVVLSNITLTESLTTGAVTMVGDVASHSFSVTENLNGHLTVVGSPGTTINNSTTFNSLPPDTSLTINLASSATKTYTNTITITAVAGAPKLSFLTVTEPAAPNPTSAAALTLTVTNFSTTGAFSVSTPGQMIVTANSDSFGSASILQTTPGCCLAQVTMNNDSIPGSVTVKEGWWSPTPTDPRFNFIKLDSDGLGASHQGATTLSQGDGSHSSASDLISVTNSDVKSLSITQNTGAPGDWLGSHDNSIVVDTVLVSTSGPGVATSQSDGNNDSTTINNVGTYGSINIKTSPPEVSIKVVQGSGNYDVAQITNSNVPGNMSIVQHSTSIHGWADTALMQNISDGVTPAYGVTTITQDYGGSDPFFPFTPTTATIDNTAAPAGYAVGSASIVQGPGSVNIANVLTVVAKFGGIAISQTDGNGDVATISASTTSPGSLGDIEIHQGAGNGDQATLSGDTADGSAFITQGDGDGDQATIQFVTAGGDISISQGGGNNDVALIDSASTVPGNISITQLDGNGDQATVSNSSAGTTALVGPYVQEFGGDINISQGNGYADQATVTGDTVNNVNVSQGNNVFTPGCDPAAYEVVTIDNSTITSDIIITQGNDSEPPSLGNYEVVIALTGNVSAGGQTKITQLGSDNLLGLGADPVAGVASGFSFTTEFMDVFMGDGGNATAYAANTTVVEGSFDGNDFVLDAGVPPDTSNTFYDLGGNSGVNPSDNFNLG